MIEQKTFGTLVHKINGVIK